MQNKPQQDSLLRQIGINRRGMATCPTCADRGLDMCRCTKGSGGKAGSGGKEEKDNKKEVDPYLELKKEIEGLAKQQRLNPFDLRKTPELVLSMNSSSGKKLSVEEDNTLQTIFDAIKNLFEQFKENLARLGVPQHILNTYNVHIDKRGQYLFISQLPAEYHDLFILELQKNNLWPGSDKFNLENEPLEKQKRTGMSPFSKKPVPRNGKRSADK